MIVFDVVGVNYVNKGAHLMLCAIQQSISRCPFPARVSLNAKATVHARKRGEHMPASLWLEGSRPGAADALIRGLGNTLPGWLKRRHRLVADREVDVVLDASGFLYSDQWGIKGLLRRRATAELWRAQNKKLIFMPQAFGPFERPNARAYMEDIIELADLIYARDQQSHDYLLDIAPTAPNIRLAPDFTNLVEPEAHSGLKLIPKNVAIVPNQRMIDKQSNGDSYKHFLLSSTKKLRSAGYHIFFLLHEARDRALAEELSGASKEPIEIVFHEDPVELKTLIGQCDFILSSRFHAIVSALSQGVPAIGTSWSHKYQRLYEDYGVPELLVTTLSESSNQAFDSVVAKLSDATERMRITRDLEEASRCLKGKTLSMWDEIFGLVAPSNTAETDTALHANTSV